jgi:ZIP family zinc transporter
MNTIMTGTMASVWASLASLVGALIVLRNVAISDKVVAALLGVAAGVMLSITCFSLIAPGLSMSSVPLVVLGILAGAACLFVIDRSVPHEHKNGVERFWEHSSVLKWIVIAAIIHNIPEGCAVGVGYSQGNISQGLSLALGIGFQNMLEGLVLALALQKLGIKGAKLFGIVLATVLIQPFTAFLGGSIVAFLSGSLAFMLAFTAGGMLFVVSSEMMPESHSQGNQRFATFGIIAGFIVMMILNAVL